MLSYDSFAMPYHTRSALTLQYSSTCTSGVNAVQSAMVLYDSVPNVWTVEATLQGPLLEHLCSVLLDVDLMHFKQRRIVTQVTLMQLVKFGNYQMV